MTEGTASSSVTGEISATAPARSISIAPGLVVLATIALATAALIKFDLSGRSFVAAFYCIVLVVLAGIDLERRVIPNRIVVPAGLIVLVGDAAAEPHRATEWLVAACATMAGALVVSLATRGGVGMGDVKLAFLLGAGLGWAVLGAIVLAVVATFVVAVTILARRGLGARKETIPLGPFLALGALLALFLT